jgi:L-lactate dehydrogenase complex protein LldG
MSGGAQGGGATAGDAARDEILARIRSALGAVAAADEAPPATPPLSPPAFARDPQAVAARLAARVADYRADVARVAGEGAIAAAVAACLERAGGGRYAVPEGLDAAWLPRLEGVEYVVDRALTPRDLAACAGSISGCALAVAETGTIVLDGGAGQGRRALTLVPDHLVVVVFERQIVATVPEAMRRLAPAMRLGARALTFVSGPSATSDIELSRVEGVHGPRRLDVLVVA